MITFVSYFTNLWIAFLGALSSIWTGSLMVLPQLVGAALILLIGWFLASFLGGLVKKILNNIPWENLLSRLKLRKFLEDRLGLSSDIGVFLGWIVKWVLIIASFIAAIDVLQLAFVNEFLGKMIAFLPMAIAAALVTFISFFVGGFMGQVFKRLIDSLNISGGEIAVLSVRWVIIFFGIFTALKFLLPNLEILTSKFADFLLFAAALAVGIGLSKKVGEWLESIKGRREFLIPKSMGGRQKDGCPSGISLEVPSGEVAISTAKNRKKYYGKNNRKIHILHNKKTRIF